jgi:hydroxymethylpyrimidine pyrophosphatase-like HAD family hydrolase
MNYNYKNGMEHLLSYYGISCNEAIAVGDNGNDLSMIGTAGLGVAMGNAIYKVKEAANYVTDTNNHNGVAKVLDKFILNNIY